ncbi:MAG: potassium transporter Trk [Cenarchaeum symbiont of Oopsacas minuta]|nr:potassium transporter Trk [Cenarchaeum symbiont of Oopsacas minuta]
MSSESQKSISYVLGQPVSVHMDTDVLKLPVFTPTRQAATHLQHYELDDIIVTESTGKPVGIVTDQDIISKVGDKNVYAETTTLDDIMSSPLITVTAKTQIQIALRTMRDHNVRKLPVVNKKGEIIGIIRRQTIADAIRNATVTAPRLLSPPIKAILGNLGFVLQFSGVLILVPAVVATILGDTVTATGIYLTTVMLLVTGFFLNSYGEKSSLNMRQASILVFSSLFILTLFGTIPYMYASTVYYETPIEAFASGFFSSAAGFTTGGISLFDTPEDLPQSFTFYRSFTQLVGGMSFIYLVITAFYPEGKLQTMRGFISGKTLHLRELFGTIIVIFSIYIMIFVSILYAFGATDIIDNVSLVMSTVATGGFVPSSTMLADMVWQQHATLMVAMILGALPFTFHYGFVRKRFMVTKVGKEVLVYFGVLAVGAATFMWVGGFGYFEGAFYAISAGTTAGLQITDLTSVGGTGYGVLIFLMFVGGCGFSTAGGIKIFRLMQISNIVIFARRSTRNSINKDDRKEMMTAVILILFFPIISLGTAAYIETISEASFAESFLEAVGLITTGGLSAGVITIDVDPASKIGMSFLMIFGRLEIIAVIYIFYPRLAA